MVTHSPCRLLSHFRRRCTTHVSSRGLSKHEALEAIADLSLNCPENKELLGHCEAPQLVVDLLGRVRAGAGGGRLQRLAQHPVWDLSFL